MTGSWAQVIFERLLLDLPRHARHLARAFPAGATADERVRYLVRKPSFEVLRDRHGDEAPETARQQRLIALESDIADGDLWARLAKAAERSGVTVLAPS